MVRDLMDRAVVGDNEYGPHASTVAHYIHELIEGNANGLPSYSLERVTELLHIAHDSFALEGFPTLAHPRTGADFVKKLEARSWVLRAYENAGGERALTLATAENIVRGFCHFTESLASLREIKPGVAPTYETLERVLGVIAHEDEVAYHARDGPGCSCRTLGE